MKRRKMGHKESTRNFTRNALRSHPRNSPGLGMPMRGGIRL